MKYQLTFLSIFIWSISLAQSPALVATEKTDEIVHHPGFTLLYSEQHEQAQWVAYVLTKEETTKRFDRTDRFLEDPLIITQSATIEDYKSSGYDRGHLAPAADLAWSEASMKASFYFSNMSPQEPSFNRGIWKKLETQVRSWAIEYDSVFIVTGPILNADYTSIGPNQVSVPTYYYKAILNLNAEKPQGIAFILKNESSKAELTSFISSIDSLEAVSGLDFFPFLEDKIEKKVESKVCKTCWNWTINQPKKEINTAISSSIQCAGKTQEGNRCKNNTMATNGYCHVHQSQAPIKPKRLETSVRCSATTQRGTQCKRMTYNMSGQCSQHEQ